MYNRKKLQDVFANAYNREKWLKQLRDIFPANIRYTLSKIESETVRTFYHLGNLSTEDNKELGIFEVQVADNTQLSRNRVQLRNLVAREIQKSPMMEGALAVYYDKSTRWRFSYIAIESRLDQEGQYEETETASKRYTYLLGEGAQIRTAIDRFSELKASPTLKRLSEAFAVEALNKEFYKKLYKWYERAQSKVTFPNDEKADKDKHTVNSLIRLLTRLLFIWFIKEKELIDPDLFSEAKVKQLIDWEKSSSFYKAILQNLFFATLNREIKDRSFRTTTDGIANSNNYLVTNVYRYQKYFKSRSKDEIIDLFSKTPFLNGGLFECLDREATAEERAVYGKDKSVRKEQRAIRIDGFSDRNDNSLSVPNELFFCDSEGRIGLINLLSQYQFTVEENTPLDIEIALDPELLGKVFENLLASYNPETEQTARQASGSYYTPREIVSYMVDESLKSYLIQSVQPGDGNMKFFKERLDGLFHIADKGDRLDHTPEEKPLVHPSELGPFIEALSEVKIIDPAVGSGAFPMGILQRIVGLLSVLDSDNQKWKAQKIKELPSLQSIEQDLKIASNINNQQARRKAEKELEKRRQEIKDIFAKQNHNYARKLYLIENCIFGVDIQAIAIQIAKLRFFISLVIDQNPTDDKADNYGILALPNLETKFVSANSLIDLKSQLALRSKDVVDKEQQLHNIRRNYINAKTLKTKRQYRDKDEQLRTEIAELLKDGGWDDTDTKKIAYWIPYDQNATAKWFNPEWMFGIAKGFDIVIGNPPYVRLQGGLADQYQDCGYKTFTGRGDIYCLFYERGVTLLKQKGYLCYITSNKWMRADYGKKLRTYFLRDTNPKQLLDFAGFQVFENTAVDTNILLLQKSTPQKQLQATRFEEGFEPDFGIADYVKRNAGKMSLSTKDAWFIDSAVKIALKEKIERMGKPLKEWDISINYGIKTGCNKAFIIDNETKEALIAEEPKSAEIIKPVLRGRNIKRYQTNWAKLWLIDTHNGYSNVPAINIDEYPAVKKRLDQFYPKLEKRADQGVTPYNLRKCDHAEFSKEKIVYPETMRRPKNANKNFPRFSLDLYGEFIPDKTTFILTGDNIHYLVAILNSQIAKLLLPLYVNSRDSNGFLMQKIYIEKFPVPLISPENQATVEKIVGLVKQIISAKKDTQSVDTDLLEEQIDQFVYNLYRLTEEEIKIVETVK